MAVTGRTIVTDALMEIGVIGTGEVLSADDAGFVLGLLARLTDLWNARREAIYADQFLTFTLTASLQPHTIGASGGTWTTSQRPVSIESIMLDTGGDSHYTITPRDAAWFQALASPGETSTIPTDFYYQPNWPLGKVYFYPVPTAAYTVQLLVRQVLSEYDLSTTFTLPPGYRQAITLTLAEMCARPFGKPYDGGLALSATQARAVVFSNNIVVPPLDSLAAGIPGRRGTYFDWQTGRVE